jgi:hypothetical protein
MAADAPTETTRHPHQVCVSPAYHPTCSPQKHHPISRSNFFQPIFMVQPAENILASDPAGGRSCWWSVYARWPQEKMKGQRFPVIMDIAFSSMIGTRSSRLKLMNTCKLLA